MSDLHFNNAFSKQVLPEVLTAMRPCWDELFENPLTESAGAEASRHAMEEARGRVAALCNARPSEVVFVSSGTEANNWALKGTAMAWERNKRHLVISAIEHFSVYQTAQFLERRGCELTVIPVDSDGFCDLGELEKAIRPSTFLVSVQSASDEIGVIQDLSSLSALKRRFPEVLFHTDAVQYLCYEVLDLRKLPFDLVSISSNALYGPPGIAALFIREGVRIVPLLHGGMQEQGLRPGLQPVALVKGFGEAARINFERKRRWRSELLRLRGIIFSALDALNVPVTGSRDQRLADNIHMLADVDGEALLTLLQAEGIAASSGSTCYQYAQKESHVLKALGRSPEEVRGSVLFTLSIQNSEEAVRRFSGVLSRSLEKLRSLKP